ncbi:MAG: multidrug efflux RND transporter permease subunit [Sphingomonas sp.]
MSRIFIDRPIFAWVIAIIIMLVGIGSITQLPIAQYPDVAPPQVNINATYPGASAETLQSSVTQILEQQLTGLDGLLYFSSNSSASGQVSIDAVFDKGVNPDIAQVQVQNAIQAAISRLPQQVQQQGVRVTKSNPDLLMIIGVYDTTDRLTNIDIGDWMVNNLQYQIGRLPGVGNVNVFGSQYAMRIWLDPGKLRSVNLQPSDVISAVQAQNTQVAAGQIGGVPQPMTNMLNATVTAQSRLQTPAQFRNIIVKNDPSGARVLLGDVARVELGAENYSTLTRVNGHPGSGMGIFLSPGADALKTAQQVKAEVAQLSKNMPAGYQYAFAYDTTNFIKLSVEEVVKTLIEAMFLVIVVMFIFLQSWRTTIIPAVAIPVVLLGTFGVLGAFGFSINTMTLFGLVLAVGLLVDDAIVVVENVERILVEQPELSVREATVLSMSQIQMALIAIALVLSAVFLPMMFFGGSTGVIYRQFAATIVSAMALSVFIALTLSPSLAANVLRRQHGTVTDSWLGRRAPGLARAIERGRTKFNEGFQGLIRWYVDHVSSVVDRKWLFLGVYGAVVVILILLFVRLPTGFIPTEDQGAVTVQYRLPPGATLGRTREIQLAVENYFLRGPEKKNVAQYFTVAGGGQGLSGQNTGQAFVSLADYSTRKGKQNSADAIVQRASAAFRGFRDAQVFVLIPPSIRGLGSASGFTMELQNTGGLPQPSFAAVRDKLLGAANADHDLSQVRLSQLPDTPTLKVDVDEPTIASLGINQSDVNSTLSAAWGGIYVNDFVDRGRVKRVFVEGDAPYRSTPQDLGQWSVRNNQGGMVSFDTFARTGWSVAPVTLFRFNGIPAYEYSGNPALGQSSGQAMSEIAKLASKFPGVSVDWSGQSYQQRLSSGQAPILYAISLIVVFLCLAALYESWSIPVAALLVIPLGLVGAVFAVTLRGLQNDVYLQVGLITTMGLSAKNAILMVEFAERAEKEGQRVIDAAIEAARIRLRPILMTSFAFIFGVLPLALSTGAGANSRIAIGTAVIGGMLTATMLAVFYIPLFFVLVRRSVRDGMKAIRERMRRPREARA